MANPPPENVTFAAAVVQSWLNQQGPPGGQGGKVTDEQFAKMSPGERLDYARRFDQTQFQQQKDRHGR
jgi:hypothetical protein